MAKSYFSDADLWNKIVDNDYRSFIVLYERHWLVLYKTARKYVHEDDSAEEIIHDLFLNLWNRRGFLKIESFKNYLKASVRYQVYAYLKKNAHTSIVYIESYPEKNELVQENTGQENLLSRDLEIELDVCLHQLPKRSQEVFSLSRKNQLSNEEIADHLGISKRSVENQITIALKHLRLHFKEFSFFSRSV